VRALCILLGITAAGCQFGNGGGGGGGFGSGPPPTHNGTATTGRPDLTQWRASPHDASADEDAGRSADAAPTQAR
jgi:hypothetical protein